MTQRQRMADVRAMAAGQFVEVFPIHMARSSSILAIVALLFVAPWAYLLGGAAVSAFVTGHFAWAGGFAVLAAGPCWATHRIFREAFPGRAYLALVPGGLALRHPVLLRRRLEVSLDQVERVEVVPGEALVSLDDRSAPLCEVFVGLPLASHVVTDVPNVAVVFKEPVEVTDIRRKPISGGQGVPRISDLDAIPGFVARVEDPDAAARAFAAWRLVDARSFVAPAPRAQRRLRWIPGTVALVLLLEPVWEWLADVF